MVSKIMKERPSTVVSFSERKTKAAPRPIRPPELDGQSPTKEQVHQALKCTERFLCSNDIGDKMLMYRAIEGVSMVTHTTVMDEMKLLKLLVLRGMLNEILNDIKEASGS